MTALSEGDGAATCLKVMVSHHETYGKLSNEQVQQLAAFCEMEIPKGTRNRKGMNRNLKHLILPDQTRLRICLSPTKTSYAQWRSEKRCIRAEEEDITFETPSAWMRYVGCAGSAYKRIEVLDVEGQSLGSLGKFYDAHHN
jgi:hypothetical protein